MWIYSKLARSLFPVESTNGIKTKIIHHIVKADGCFWEEIQCSIKF